MNTNGKPAGRSESEAHFTLMTPEMIELLGRRKWYLIWPVLIALALGAFYLFEVAPLYHVQARVLVQRQGLPLAQDHPTKDNVEFLATQAEIIRSPAIVEQAVESLDFMPYEGPEIDPTVEILKSLRVQPVLGTNVLSIDFYGIESGQAVQIVEAIIESYRQYLYGIDHDTHLESLRVLTRSERDLRLDLSELERKYLALRKNSPLMGQGRDAISIQRSLLTQLGEKLTDARNRRMQLENRLQTMGKAAEPMVAAITPTQPTLFAASLSTPWQPNMSIPRPGNAPMLPGISMHDVALSVNAESADLEKWYATAANSGIEMEDLRPIRQGLFDAQARLEALKQRFGPRHPELRAVEQEVSTWQHRLQEAICRAPQLMNQELKAAELYEHELADLYKAEFSEAKAVDGYVLEEQQLLDGIARVQSIHDSILTQVQQWQLADQALAEGRSGVAVRELETPAMTERVIFPPPLLLAFLCVVVGLIGGSTAITILEHTNTRVQSPEQLNKRLARDIVGRIPAMSVPRHVLAKPVYRSRLVRELPESSVAEAFRALRTRLTSDAGGNGNGNGNGNGLGRVIQ
ncbi:MAG TPA: Wzz/FepE/Etk N-terminal domain-containing protein, partial [Thermoguttaceae bacterium]|nr:Wzz/FepE/Etk N-terminal domain-containing protein [Thermoguttaceae bacterium]